MMLTLGYGGAKKRKVFMQEEEKEVKKRKMITQEDEEKGTDFDEEFVTAGDAHLDDIEVDKETVVVEDNRISEVGAAVIEERSEKEEEGDEEKEDEIAEDEEEEVVDFTLLSEDELGLADEDEPMEG